jgi:hypothetical protein
MNDELIDRLRRTMHHEAEAIRPSARSYLAAHDPAPARLRRTRPAWPLAAAIAAATAAAVALIAVNLAGGGHSVRVGNGVTPAAAGSTSASRSSTTAPSPTAAAVSPTTLPVGAARPAATVPSATTGTAPPPPPLPTSFAPVAVTFVSPSEGWTLGTAPCAAGRCLMMARTSDAGTTWRQANAPDAGNVGGLSVSDLSVRFADPADGWVYANRVSSPSNPSRLWSTHDGGMSWQPVDLGVLAGGTITELEAAGHLVQLAVMSERDGSLHVEASPIGVDDWMDVRTGVPVGAGPVPSTQLVLQGTSGWVIQNDRTVVGGAHSTGAGRWSSWTPPCAGANGTAALAASSSADLVAVCNEGAWGPPANLPAGTASQMYPQWIFRSTDGGATFRPVKSVPAGFTAGAIATSPSPATVVLAGSTGRGASVLASFDGGLTWQTVYRNSTTTQWKDVGFTTTDQGVAVAGGPSGSVLLMTRDGGHNWQPVSL